MDNLGFKPRKPVFRAKRRQFAHDRAVGQLASLLGRKGHTHLKVDLPGLPRPRSMFGFRPDLMSIARSGRKLIAEVEPAGSLSSHARTQMKAFQRYARQSRADVLLVQFKRAAVLQNLP